MEQLMDEDAWEFCPRAIEQDPAFAQESAAVHRTVAVAQVVRAGQVDGLTPAERRQRLKKMRGKGGLRPGSYAPALQDASRASA